MPRKRILDPVECAVCGTTFTPKDTRRRACSRSCGGKLGNTKEAREKGKKTRFEKYGDENFNNREKVRKTIQSKYGEQYINSSQVPEIKKKIVDSYTKNNGGMGMASKSTAKKVLDSAKKNLGIEDESIINVGQIDSVKNKIKETTTDKWGGIGFASEELAERSLTTFKDKHGEDLYSGEVRKGLIKDSFLNKHGVDNLMAIPGVKDKVVKSYTERHGGMGGARDIVKIEREMRMKEFKNYYKKNPKSTPSELAEKMNVSKGTIHTWAKEMGIVMTKGSRINQDWNLFLKNSTGIEFEYEGYIYGDNRKVDLYNNKFKIAIEINPTITHSTQATPFHNKKVPVKYHQERAIAAEKNGWTLIQVFDWDKKENIAKLIKTLCIPAKRKVYARNCHVERITSKEAQAFLELNHRQGGNFTGNIAFGLYYKDELMQVMTFSKERFNRNSERDSFELIRMASEDDCVVVGGASKLFQFFINSDIKPMKIKTFSDYSKGLGGVYEKIGMKYVGLANLNAFYSSIDTSEAYKVTVCSSKFSKEYKSLGLTQQQYMNSKRFYRINDAGNKIFEWKREEK